MAAPSRGQPMSAANPESPVFDDVYRGERVLITGDTGFKGSWLTAWLDHLGAEVHGFALPPERAPNHFTELRLSARIHHTDGDVRVFDEIEAAVRETQPTVVFHLAAQALVSRGYREPRRTFDTNIGGGLNLLEAVRETSSVRALVFITSDKAYLNKEWTWGYRERDELGGTDPYGASKAAVESVFDAYQSSYFDGRPGFAAATARAGNVFGGGDWSENRIVPDCVRSLLENEPISLRSPNATRPWQHVLEPLCGYLLLGSRLLQEGPRFAGAWNFGPAIESNLTVREFAERMSIEWGLEPVISESGDSHGHEADLLHLNVDKARHGLGWRPTWDAHEGTRRTVKWFKAWAAGEDIWATTVSQISDYEAALREWAG
jgi:CDP-glucose 4,6-dehydratase